MSAEFPFEQLRATLLDLKQKLERQKAIYRELFIQAFQNKDEEAILRLEKEILENKKDLESVEADLRALNNRYHPN